ncbi:MTH1187 family thiamine-binding protein [Candidatus Bathyarchaeota archaeon]|nr:MTH1187 family thiamine-binding protein [Candidatus Bathyarchaeota archaeon]
MSVIVEFSVIPMGETTSVSRFVAHAVKALDERGVKYETTSMGTIFEAGSLREALRYVETAHEAVFKAGARRVVTMIKIDDRRDVERKMEDKIKSLKKAFEEL